MALLIIALVAETVLLVIAITKWYVYWTGFCGAIHVLDKHDVLNQEELKNATRWAVKNSANDILRWLHIKL